MLAEEAELISASPESLRLPLDVATVTLSIKSFAPAAVPPVASQLPDTNTNRYSPAQQLSLYRAFIEHTVEHFAQEERWMLATGFTADNCHAGQHATILETMNAVLEHSEKGDAGIIKRMAQALFEWFPQHAASMDAGLAQHLKNVGFNSSTETLTDPSTVRPASMSGCGTVSCS